MKFTGGEEAQHVPTANAWSKVKTDGATQATPARPAPAAPNFL